MDQVKIGNFIAKLRNENNLTQEALGEKLGVTNKTISRWENGHYLPDIEMLQLLSKEFNVSINELITGERIQENEYKEKAEENLLTVLENSTFTLKEKTEYYRKKWIKEHTFELTIEMIVIIALIIFCIVKYKDMVFVACICGYAWSIYQYNKMMAYIENRAYNKDNK